ncbi:hypothetical protein FRC02_004101 [Tulasnella sp. 418]|nr:hypothetical protein FRC02_004101 [Tulasnella sp. 418]
MEQDYPCKHYNGATLDEKEESPRVSFKSGEFPVISDLRPQSGEVHDASRIDGQTIEELIYHIGIHTSGARV